jgi:acetolactate synthase regulatory subunit
MVVDSATVDASMSVAPLHGPSLARPGRPGTRLESNASTAPVAEESPPPSQSPLPQEVAPGSMLVRTGQASLQVDTLDAGIARVREVARRTGAVVANTSVEGGRDQTRAATLELRIPSERFDEAVNGLSPIGKVESVNVSVQDVGEEFVDGQARVANARRLEQRLVELLANRTGKLSDVLTVERELARVREEIERYEGRLRYLRSRASISTLSIAMHEPYPIVARHPGASPIRDAFVQAWRNLVGVTAGIIASLGVIVPIGALVVMVALVGRRVLAARAFFRLSKPVDAEGA